MDLTVPRTPQAADIRRAGAEALIRRARALLNGRDEDIVVNYLDHAIEALNIVAEGAVSPPA